MEMGVGEALLVSLSGFVIVFLLLIFLIIVISVVSRVVMSFEGKNAPAKTAAPAAAPEPAPEAAPAPAAADDWDGRLRLIDCDEKTAACIMAIVSDETKIPLDELQFRRIRAL